MGLFSFLKKEEKKTSSVILGMVLLKKNDTLKITGVVNELKDKWNLIVADDTTPDDVSVLSINNYNVAIAVLPHPIPGNEVEEAASYNYFWKNAIEDLKDYEGHILVSVLNGGKNSIEENILFTQVISAVLNNSDALGLYMGGRTLLLKKDFYQANTEALTTGDLPVYNWIYFGLRKENDTQSMYTYGLTEFGKSEIEILDSDKPFEELNDLLYNIVNYVLAYEATLKHGQTLGFSESQKLKITESKGKYLEGKTLKISF